MQIEYNRFFPSPSGERGEHVKVTVETFEDLRAAVIEVQDIFADADYIPFDEPHPLPVTAGKSDVVVCGICKGPVYDNRAKKASGEYTERRADFSCKKKSCDAAMWLTRDGEHGEWKQFSSR